MEKQRYLSLLEKYLAGKSTRKEELLLDEYYKRLEAMSDVELSGQQENLLKDSILKKIRSTIDATENKPQQMPKRSLRIWYAAASVLVMIAVGSFFIHTDKKTAMVSNLPGNIKPEDIRPGSNKAVLTLSNGKQIVLNNPQTGVLAKEGTARIIKKENGELVYDPEDKATGQNEQPVYNTITVPRGGQYQVVLADGSKVFLNAASSLTYPTRFSGRYRNVELKGEGYFEVAKNAAMPFIVTANDVQVRVLGTHFNISAYADDASITTTLIEGAVSLNKGKLSKLLAPGQQGISAFNNPEILVQPANIEQTMGWVKGNFVFKDLNIKEVMKIASRWYDIEVEYRGNAQSKKFGGTTSRFSDITELLNYMKITGGVNYKIEGRRVILMN
ncbi:FecR family protein [Pedobacter vanadiisoli]|uniref:FecR family protein n=1 Tax=Pedobacter vanadiisoli TaxID=1761975 RepID=A0ABW5MMD9_9SPHI